MEEHPCSDGTNLDSTIYLRRVQTLKDYFEAKGCFNEDSFMVASQKLP